MPVMVLMLTPERERRLYANWFIWCGGLGSDNHHHECPPKLTPHFGVFCLMMAGRALGKYGINLLLTMSKLLVSFYCTMSAI